MFQRDTTILAAFFLGLSIFSTCSHAAPKDELALLQNAYPDYVVSVSNQAIVWQDGTIMPATDDKPNKTTLEKVEHPALIDQVSGVSYPTGRINLRDNFSQKNDAGRVRYELFFRKMYGDTKEAVESHLVWIEWMPHVFKDAQGKALYKLRVTTVNHVNEKLEKISAELEKLPASFYPYLENPAGTYDWRNIANTDRLSNHSFGMTMDINTSYSSYWQWDLKKEDRPLNEMTVLSCHENRIPWEIVEIFEKYGFIWGGKWYHYDTMHFEYRPELLTPTAT